jgi:hypothetical protein
MRLSRRAFKPHRNQRYRPYRGSDFDRDFGCNPAMQPTLRRLREAQLEPLLIIGAGAALIVGVLWLTVLLLVVTWPWLLLGSVVFWSGFGAGLVTAWTIRKS